MSTEQNEVEKEPENKLTEEFSAAEENEDEDEFEEEDEEEEDDDDEYEEEYEEDVETEIEHQTPEVIAKELLITYLETNAFAQPDPGPGENRYQAVGRAIGEVYNALLEEIRKTAY